VKLLMNEKGYFNGPSQQGYFMPAEWHPHEATWLSWPKDPLTWPDKVPQVQEIFLEIIRVLTQGEEVRLLVDDQATEEAVGSQLSEAELRRLVFHQVQTVDSWIRDYGPNFLLRRNPEAVELVFNDWMFNAWGNKYEELKRDTLVPVHIAGILGVPFFSPGIVLEGGSIDVNGERVCMTTEQCLLNANRNPTLTRDDIEGYLKNYLGVEKVIWLGEGIAGDDTDGHIDDIARFVAPDTIVYALEEDPADADYAPLQDNFRRLRSERDHRGRPFQLVPLPMPGAVMGPEGRLPASYANFYIANGHVLVPTFGHKNDARALEQLQALFPDRRVIGLHSEPLVHGLGAIHCVTQQQPARV
jgi:agmatine deiminase